MNAQRSIHIDKTILYVDDKQYVNDIKRTVAFRPSSGFWDEVESVPKYTISIKVAQASSATFDLLDFQVEELSQKEIALLNQTAITEKFQIQTNIQSQRFQHFAMLEITAVRKNASTGKFEKIVRFEGDLTTTYIPPNRPKSFVSNSVLQPGSGDWYKLAVTKDGVYKIDYTMLESMGVAMNALSPNTLHIYGNAQGMLSEYNGAPRLDDLASNALFIKGDADGRFDPEDYLLFYAKGPHTWDFDGTDFSHERNCYTDTANYFLNVSSSVTANRIGNAVLSNASPTATVTKFADYQFIEDDNDNLIKSGREWFGDGFDITLNNNYNFSFADISTVDSAWLKVAVAIRSTSVNSKFTASVAGISAPVQVYGSPSGQGTLAPKGKIAVSTIGFRPNSSSNLPVNLSFDKAGYLGAKAWLDYLGMRVTRNLQMSGQQMEFRDVTSVGAGNISEFRLSNANDVEMIWDVTDPLDVRKVNYSGAGSLKSFTIATDELHNFVALTDAQYFTPVVVGKVENQDLHALPYADMLIITSPAFLTASNRLADFHTSEGLSVHVVTQQQIFNEYSSGMRDPVAIRHFLKMFYDRAQGDPNKIPKYCLLFGDASYDYRNRLNSNSDFVITYESRESLSPVGSFAADDFFVILDDNATMENTALMDLAIGRLPVQTAEEAEGMVDKIILHGGNGFAEASDVDCVGGENTSIFGDWRNKVVMVSDDEDNNAYFDDVEIMHAKLNNDPALKALNVVKVHSDAYVEGVTPGGERNFDAESAIRENVQNGSLLVNYIGHGGEVGWAHEQLLTVPTINNWNNGLRLPVFMTATCEFSRFDDHDRVSAGEYVVLNPSGAGIGLFTTTRLVLSSSNEVLTRFFYDTVFDKINGAPPVLGNIYLGTKNKFALNNGGGEFRKFTLLGDPAIQMGLPRHNVVADSVNGMAIQSFSDTLKALSKVKISGHVENYLGAPLTNYNGVVYPTIFDKQSQLQTLGNSSGSYAADFEMWKNIVYKGKATVTNGNFSFEFIIPKDIAYDVDIARFSFYIENGQEDGHGYDESPLMGGINTNANADNQGPDISLFLNNESFVNGGITDENPVLIAQLFDENGINTVGNGIGHNIEIRIDEEAEPIVLNEYYEADLDTYKSGEVSFPLTDVEPGDHTLRLKVWDVYNNSTDATLDFTVIQEEELSINHLLNYPNPFTTATEFSFEHNQVCDYLDVQLQIFTISGHLVKTIQQRVHSDGFRVHGIQWDARDDFGDKLAIGTYVYKLTVENESGNQIEEYERLVILN